MKKNLFLLLFSSMVLFGTQCTDDQDTLPSKSENKPYSVVFKFNVNDKIKEFSASFVYDESQQRYIIKSGDIIEIKALDSETRKIVYVYTLKQYDLPKNNYRVEWERKTGYYGYYEGCFYWGELLVGDNGVELFTPGSTSYNPPLCPGGQWAYVGGPRTYVKGFNTVKNYNIYDLLPY